MKVLELFSGSQAISNAFRATGHEAYTVDWNSSTKPDLVKDISTLTVQDILELCGGCPDVIWASPDCTTYSVLALRYYRKKNAITGNSDPTCKQAQQADEAVKHTLALIKALQPRYWFIENPLGALRKMNFMQGLRRYTVTYCQYGHPHMKPTDIWSNHTRPMFKPMCKRGAPCHTSAPRNTYSGTVAMKNAAERAAIPLALCQHIIGITNEQQ